MEPSKTRLSPPEAKAMFGTLRKRLPGGHLVYQSFQVEGGWWRPRFDQDLVFLGYEFVKLQPMKRPHWRRRGRL